MHREYDHSVIQSNFYLISIFMKYGRVFPLKPKKAKVWWSFVVCWFLWLPPGSILPFKTISPRMESSIPSSISLFLFSFLQGREHICGWPGDVGRKSPLLDFAQGKGVWAGSHHSSLLLDVRRCHTFLTVCPYPQSSNVNHLYYPPENCGRRYHFKNQNTYSLPQTSSSQMLA